MSENPQYGLLFVLATLLPLASFVLLLLLGAVRWGLRPYAKENASVNNLFQMLGGDVPGTGPAYFALGAIGLAFLCSLTGFILFVPDEHHHHQAEHDLMQMLKEDGDHHEHGEAQEAGAKAQPKAKDEPKGEKKDAKQEPKDEKKKDGKDEKKKDAKEEKKKETPEQKKTRLTAEINQFKHRWEGQLEWARLFPSDVNARDPERAAKLTVGFRIDMLSAIMFVMVTFIATLIHLFSIGYMSEELNKTVEDHEVHMAHGHLERRGRFGRFFMYLSLFCFSMLNLILADNLFQVFVSWELVGICSFLLISFYFERTSASNAANKAFITNRIGDAGFIVGLLIVWTYFGTFNFQEIFTRIRCPEVDAHGAVELKIEGRSAAERIVRANLEGQSRTGAYYAAPNPEGKVALIFPRASNHLHAPGDKVSVYDEPGKGSYGYLPYWLLVIAGLGIFLGCVGKSAQFPLQVWLPDAMEGPTPVSALIHAATMVAAGVYLVGRCYPIFTPEVLLTIAYVGGITLFVAATIAVVMTDIKKVLAYSTVSQLGYMMLALGVGGWTAGLLHLLTHAFFKALLFLGSGSVIYGCHHQQDMLKMGGLYPKMKITALTMLMGVLAIAGTPFFSGWYSKDEILVAAYGFMTVHKQHFLLFLLPLVTAGITTFYMFRMWFMTFCGKPKDHHVYEHAHESPWMMTTPLILLAILSVCVAWGIHVHAEIPPQHPADSWLGQQLHHYSQPNSVDMVVDKTHGPQPVHVDFIPETKAGAAGHSLVGLLALFVVGIGLVFALVLYYYGVLDPADAKEQFPGVHRFLAHKWYFDEVYSALLVRPALAIAHWCRNFDTYVIDGFLHFTRTASVWTSKWSGKFDRGIIDGSVNLLADVSFAIGNYLRSWQTGYLRSYVLFLALAAMGIWMLLYALANALGGN